MMTEPLIDYESIILSVQEDFILKFREPPLIDLYTSDSTLETDSDNNGYTYKCNLITNTGA